MEIPQTETAPERVVKYFKKELVSNRLALPNGKRVHFEQIGDTDTGVLATDDAGLIAELEKAVAARRGGVVAIDEQTYSELKKNPAAKPTPIRSLNAQSLKQLFNQKSGDTTQNVVAANQPSAPMEVPKGLVTVSSRKRLKERMQPNPPSVA